LTHTERSPLKDKSLRLPGQSTSERLEKLLDERIETPGLWAALCIVLAGLEWWRWYKPIPPQPILYSVVALLAVLYAGWRVWRTRPAIRALRLGIEGERAVGQFFERLRAQGYHVLHDVLAQDFNIDHVLIGPAGVITVETKTWSKPRRGDAKIMFDGERLLIQSKAPERDPIAQARAQASWLRRVLAESTGRELPVRAVVVFPGWYVERTPGGPRDVWVLEPKALPAFLAKEPEQLQPEDVHLAAFHLSRFVRVGGASPRAGNGS
jgi:hypothetical protein